MTKSMQKGKEMTSHFSILAWRVPWREEPGRLESMGLQRVGHDWATNTIQREMWWSVAPRMSRNLVLMVLCRSCWFHKVSACSENHILSRPWTICFQNSLENDSLRWANCHDFFPFLVIWKGVKKHLKIASLQFHRYHGDHELGYSHFQWYRKTGFLWCLFYNLKPSSFRRLGADDWWRSHPVQFHDQTEDTEFFFSNIELCQL